MLLSGGRVDGLQRQGRLMYSTALLAPYFIIFYFFSVSFVLFAYCFMRYDKTLSNLFLAGRVIFTRVYGALRQPRAYCRHTQEDCNLSANAGSTRLAPMPDQACRFCRLNPNLVLLICFKDSFPTPITSYIHFVTAFNVTNVLFIGS
ncbi:hypothetical protein BDZ91DRAFT_21751 [Kalaharituber pfeilii]|nr:hypothetical protein BDZ91DRAFT_21751 [Kalaharituber pfeilii]